MSSPPAQVLHEQQQQQQQLQRPPVPRQDTLHTDSGLDTEEIVPASPPRPPEQLVGRPNCPKSAQADEQRKNYQPAATGAAASAIPALLGAAGDEDVIIDGVRMVLVRDIGVQVCGDSPLLNSTREEQSTEVALIRTQMNVFSSNSKLFLSRCVHNNTLKILTYLQALPTPDGDDRIPTGL